MIKKWKCYCSAIVQSFFPAPIGITGKSIAISSKKKTQMRYYLIGNSIPRRRGGNGRVKLLYWGNTS
jgi:hypothetical protein